MYAIPLPKNADEHIFREAARRCLALDLAPNVVSFVDETEPSLLSPIPDEPTPSKVFGVPKAYGTLLRETICHSATDRYDLLYEVLWRVLHGEKALVTRASDPRVARLNEYARNVRRDIHKMHAFLRFRARELEGRTLFTAWFEPQHFILRRAVPFFVDRFSQMDWLIATPSGTAIFEDGQLQFGPPPEHKPNISDDNVLDELWLTYYRATFNPARLRTKAMVNEMPRHYWANLPEAALIPEMITGAAKRVERMANIPADRPQLFAERIAAEPREDGPAPSIPLDKLRAEAATCTRCPLHGPATQTVFGQGSTDAKVMLVGEQPGDQEDLMGHPFVGPAGELLDRALIEACLDRKTLYVTNVVKHFKYEPRGKRRIHQKPNAGEVTACRWWLEREIATIRPRLIVALGSTAANALAGRPVSVTRERGAMAFRSWNGFVTTHPSYLLRIPAGLKAKNEYSLFVQDLRQVAGQIEHF